MSEPLNAEILRRLRAGETQVSLAKEFGLTPAMVRDACREAALAEHNPERAARLKSREVRVRICLWSQDPVAGKD